MAFALAGLIAQGPVADLDGMGMNRPGFVGGEFAFRKGGTLQRFQNPLGRGYFRPGKSPVEMPTLAGLMTMNQEAIMGNQGPDQEGKAEMEAETVVSPQIS
ncbi:MAG: hypothetical protein ABI036_15990 [Fibrobacteria bacterium]